MTAPDCRVRIAGAWFADTAAAFEAGTPTALAELELTWGRATTVDQPDAATCRVAVADRAGGADLLDALPIGAPFEVWAAGDIGAGTAADVAVDGSFEALPAGPITGTNPRVIASGGALEVTGNTATDGAQSIGWNATAAGATLVIPAAAFDTATPDAWDAIPRLAVGAVWVWSLGVRAPIGTTVTAELYGVTSSAGPVGAPAGPPLDVPAADVWHTVTATTTVEAAAADKWPAVRVTFGPLATWAATADTWADAPGRWVSYGPILFVDALELEAPPSVIRDVLVFAGRITDLSVIVNPLELAARADVIATDQRAELENRWVGATPWPAETLAARYSNILAAAELAVTTRIDAPLDAELVSKRDVDNQPAGGLLTEHGAGVDGVLWSATHATLGPFLWLEDVRSRVALGALELVGGIVTIVVGTPSHRAPGRTTLDGCEIAADGVIWRRDVTDVLNRIDATWLEQTAGTDPPVEHTLTVTDAAAEAATGSRRLGLATNLTTAAAADAVARRVLARSRIAQWRAEGLAVDCARFPPAPGLETADVLDLLDGTTRLGRGLIIENIVGWPGGDTAGGYLDGGTYRWDGAGWVLELATTPMGGFGASCAWRNLDPTWRWNQMAPDIAWSDMYGVTGPVAAELELETWEVS